MWDRIHDANLKGHFLCTREALSQYMLAHGQGVIIFISSGSGKKGEEDSSAYCASKWGDHRIRGVRRQGSQEDPDPRHDADAGDDPDADGRGVGGVAPGSGLARSRAGLPGRRLLHQAGPGHDHPGVSHLPSGAGLTRDAGARTRRTCESGLSLYFSAPALAVSRQSRPQSPTKNSSAHPLDCSSPGAARRPISNRSSTPKLDATAIAIALDRAPGNQA